jgi:hypothetical protein
LVEADSFQKPVHGKNDRECHSDFSRGDHDDKDSEHLAIQAIGTVTGESNEIDIRRIQNQLDPHQDIDGVLPREHAKDAKRKQRRAQQGAASLGFVA